MTIGEDARLGWWLVDPASGATIDMLDDGSGATLVEDAIIFTLGVIFGAELYNMGFCIGSTVGGIMDFLDAHPGSSVIDVPIRTFACGA